MVAKDLTALQIAINAAIPDNTTGLVDPVDDLRATNPPSNPALLEALADDFREQGFDQKKLSWTVEILARERNQGFSEIFPAFVVPAAIIGDNDHTDGWLHGALGSSLSGPKLIWNILYVA